MPTNISKQVPGSSPSIPQYLWLLPALLTLPLPISLSSPGSGLPFPIFLYYSKVLAILPLGLLVHVLFWLLGPQLLSCLPLLFLSHSLSLSFHDLVESGPFQMPLTLVPLIATLKPSHPYLGAAMSSFSFNYMNSCRLT